MTDKWVYCILVLCEDMWTIWEIFDPCFLRVFEVMVRLPRFAISSKITKKVGNHKNVPFISINAPWKVVNCPFYSISI